MTTSTTNRLAFLEDDLQQLKDQHLYQELMVMDSAQGVEITIDGRPLLNFSSNNYLGLNTHPKLKEAAKQAIDKYGVGTGSVRTIIGTQDIHQELESKLAEFKHTEASLVLQSGFMANTAAVCSIMTDQDVILTDELNHASIIDACRLLKNTPRHIFRHADMAHLETLLGQEAVQAARQRLIITDGIFSMDGDIAPLDKICALANQYNALVMVDDAHASGVLGAHGSGTANHFGVSDQVHIHVGTLSKAVGALGGYVASTRAMREIMINKARPFLFSTSHPPSVAATCLAALQVMQTEPQWMERLWANTNAFKAGMKALGYDADSPTPIVPVIVGESALAQQLSKRLFELGIYARAIVFPTVARDKARVRVQLCALHTPEHIEQALTAFETVGRELGIL
ncbi:MAG: glycine C-acetyltransferase [Cyanobacteria bacterium HKST-UBA06]|nr:glycine C-acetyltransferase [Cyanobacteria bacterium HKST-UBA06]